MKILKDKDSLVETLTIETASGATITITEFATCNSITISEPDGTNGIALTENSKKQKISKTTGKTIETSTLRCQSDNNYVQVLSFNIEQ